MRGDVAERRRHQHELRARQQQQRHLPRPAAVGVAVEVELVHHDLVDVGVRALAQREVREDLGGAADDRRVGVDRRVARDHADVLGAEDVDEREELLAHERLDRRRVVACARPAARRGGVRGDRDERLAGAGRGRQDDVRPRDDLDDRLVLRRVEREAALGRPLDEPEVDGIGVGAAGTCVERGSGASPESARRPRRAARRWRNTGPARTLKKTTKGCRCPTSDDRDHRRPQRRGRPLRDPRRRRARRLHRVPARPARAPHLPAHRGRPGVQRAGTRAGRWWPRRWRTSHAAARPSSRTAPSSSHYLRENEVPGLDIDWPDAPAPRVTAARMTRLDTDDAVATEASADVRRPAGAAARGARGAARRGARRWSVHRALPQRDLPLVGRVVLPRPLRAAGDAHARRAPPAHRAADGDLAVRRRRPPPRHRRQRRGGAPRRAQPHDERRGHRALRVLGRRGCRSPRRAAALGRAARVAAARRAGVRAARRAARGRLAAVDGTGRRRDGRARRVRRRGLARDRRTRRSSAPRSACPPARACAAARPGGSTRWSASTATSWSRSGPVPTSPASAVDDGHLLYLGTAPRRRRGLERVGRDAVPARAASRSRTTS